MEDLKNFCFKHVVIWGKGGRGKELGGGEKEGDRQTLRAPSGLLSQILAMARAGTKSQDLNTDLPCELQEI